MQKYFGDDFQWNHVQCQHLFRSGREGCNPCIPPVSAPAQDPFPWASAESFPWGTTSTFCLYFSGCWRCNVNGSSRSGVAKLGRWGGPPLAALLWGGTAGYAVGYKPATAITTIYDELLRNFYNKLITCSLFLDLSKSFDCCDHEILLDKLYHYGIRGVSHKLFLNFLRNRMQCTKIGHLNPHTKGYLAGSLRVVLFHLCFSLFTLTISQKLPLFILLYLLMILISICQIPVLMFFRQLLTLNYVKWTTGWEPTSFLLTTIRRILCY